MGAHVGVPDTAIFDWRSGTRSAWTTTRRSGPSYGEEPYKGTVIFMWNRRKSFLVRTGPGGAQAWMEIRDPVSSGGIQALGGGGKCELGTSIYL